VAARTSGGQPDGVRLDGAAARRRLERGGVLLGDLRERMLALDGGGIRGLITIEILGRLEAQLREARGGDPNFVLSDFFDYVGGTSTGAIIAAGISLGMPIATLRDFYLRGAKAMFSRASIFRRWHYRNLDTTLSEKLREVVGHDRELGDPDLRTLLLLVMKNATTDAQAKAVDALATSTNPLAYAIVSALQDGRLMADPTRRPRHHYRTVRSRHADEHSHVFYKVSIIQQSSCGTADDQRQGVRELVLTGRRVALTQEFFEVGISSGESGLPQSFAR